MRNDIRTKHSGIRVQYQCLYRTVCLVIMVPSVERKFSKLVLDVAIVGLYCVVDETIVAMRMPLREHAIYMIMLDINAYNVCVRVSVGWSRVGIGITIVHNLTP
jgi:hypothetical protein